MEEQFKKHLQDDISHDFSHQSLILSVLLIGFFLIFSLAPQQIGLYRDLKSVEGTYHHLLKKNRSLLKDLNQTILASFLSHQLTLDDLGKQYYHFRNHSQSQTELMIFSPENQLLFASNQQLGNFFNQSVYMSQIIQEAKSKKNLVKIIMDNEEEHFLAMIEPIRVNNLIKGYSVLLMNGKDFLPPSKDINSDIIISDRFDNSFVFSNRDFISSSLHKVDSRLLKGYFIFHGNRAFILRQIKLSPTITLFLYRPLIPIKMVLLFSLISSLIIFMVLNWKSRSLADKIASKNSRAITQITRDMAAISRQEKSRIELSSQDEFQFLAGQINQMVGRLQGLNDKTLELEKQRLNFEKRMLEAQFNPHFLYNTLETILITSHYDPELTEKIVLRLTKLLRYSLNGSSEAVPLKEDLAVLESYLVINKVRFEELDYEIVCDKTLEDLKIPKLFLLPVVENSIKYGFRHRHDVSLGIEISRVADTIYFAVSDNGPGISPDRQAEIRALLESEDSHHGLVNSYRRLKHHFSEVTLSFEKREKDFLLLYKIKE
ncbi:sensor histidine kinase [Streptococcus catagoni]|uniref:sensor histidine kinase n=1 Tax=Streptococcus catagoni TaxID=2654874 RepID=UPI00140C2357|nr:sensor histidine kinase [Streptococcus catagoni]